MSPALSGGVGGPSSTARTTSEAKVRASLLTSLPARRTPQHATSPTTPHRCRKDAGVRRGGLGIRWARLRLQYGPTAAIAKSRWCRAMRDARLVVGSHAAAAGRGGVTADVLCVGARHRGGWVPGDARGGVRGRMVTLHCTFRRLQ
eukprot:3203063-Prymnesium_polylepis.1